MAKRGSIVQDDSDMSEINISPMIDMVFLLLIFFIVASIVVEEKVRVDIPTAVYAVVPEDITGRFIISINQKEELFVGTRRVTMDEMKNLLKPQVEENPKLRVMIRADGSVKYKVTEEVMNACGDVGAVDMIYSAFEQ